MAVGPFGAMPGGKAKPNSIITGTGPAAFSGVVSVNWMSTLMSGYAELSTWPTSRLVTTGTLPTVCFSVAVTFHSTFGTSFGTRP